MIVKINFSNREYFELLELTNQNEHEIGGFLHSLILKNLNMKPSENLSNPTIIDQMISYFHKKMMPKYNITQVQLAHIFKVSQPAISKVLKNGTGNLGKKIRSYSNEKDLEEQFVIPLFFQIYKNSYDSLIFDLNDPHYGLELSMALHNPIEYISASFDIFEDLTEILPVVIGYCWVNGFTKNIPYDENGFFFFFDTIKTNLSKKNIIEYIKSKDRNEKKFLLDEILENLDYIIDELVKPQDSFY